MEGALEMNWYIVEMPYPQLRKRLCLAAHFHLMIDWNVTLNMKQVKIYSYINLYNSWLRWSIPSTIMSNVTGQTTPALSSTEHHR